MEKLFQHSKESPFHISVGAVVYNERGDMLVHKFVKESVPPHLHHLLGDLSEAYTFMRESLENNETIESAIARGLREEFGVTGSIVRYLGSTQVVCSDRDGEWEKTTLYCAVAYEAHGDRDQHDEESYSELVWMTPNDLLEQMKAQSQPHHPSHLNELPILETFLHYHDL